MKRKLTNDYRATRKHIVITDITHELIIRVIDLYKYRTHLNITGGQVIERLVNRDKEIVDLFNEVH